MSDHPLQMSSRRRWAVTGGVMTGMFLAALEATVVGTAMPTVIAALGGLNRYSWVFSAYLLTSTVTVPVWGKLSDLYGRRVLYQVGVAVFLIGSALSGFSTTMLQLIIFRAIQGLGAGALVPLAMTMIADIFTLEQRARMQGLFSGVWGISSVIGPLVGGFITDQWNWRWVFFINLPIGIVSALVIWFAMPDTGRHERPSIDYAGAVTLMLSMTLLMIGLMGEGSPARNATLILLSLVVLAAFVVIEQRAREPVIPFTLFRNRVVFIGVLVGFLAGVGMFGAISFIPLFAQGVRGATATEAGSLLTPLMLSWVLMSIVGGRLLLRVGYKSLVVIGSLALVVSFFFFAGFDRLTPYWKLLVDLCVMGSGLGLVMLTLLIAVQHSVPRTQLGIATSLNQFSRSIGGAIGVAVMGLILTAGMAGLNFDASAIIHGAGETSVHPPGPVQTALGSALQKIFFLGGIVSIGALIGSFFLPGGTTASLAPSSPRRDTGEEMVMAELTTIDSEHEPVAPLRD